MQQLIKYNLQIALNEAIKANSWQIESLPELKIERCRDPNHGDFASNLAMLLAKTLKTAPQEIANKILQLIPENKDISRIEIAGQGFINFKISDEAFYNVLLKTIHSGESYGCCFIGRGKRIHLEFVSANPTGPLHVGHGRSAAYAACVGNLLAAVGYQVHREYYVNDAGRQMRILALSTWLRYLQLLGETIDFPTNAYQGDYISDIASEIIKTEGEKYLLSGDLFLQRINQANKDLDNPEIRIDTFITTAQALLGEASFAKIQKITLETILDDIRNDLSEFGVTFNEWFYESQLFELGLIDAGIQLLKQQGHVYEKDGAVWFSAIHFGDEKDRVLIRENGQSTYFASDVAYHLYKYQQNYDEIVDVFGADHHGYIARIRAFLQGLGKNPNQLKILLVQFVTLYRGKERISMSTRSGSFVTLRELREEVGNDAARYFYISRKPEQHLDFDLELAKQQSSDNPVYYIQYAYARICSIWRQSKNNDQLNFEQIDITLLKSSVEKELLRKIESYPDLIHQAALSYAPHQLAHFLHEFCHLFHNYYNNERFLIDNVSLRNARLCLVKGVQQVIKNGLTLLGISTPEQM